MNQSKRKCSVTPPFSQICIEKSVCHDCQSDPISVSGKVAHDSSLFPNREIPLPIMHCTVDVNYSSNIRVPAQYVFTNRAYVWHILENAWGI